MLPNHPLTPQAAPLGEDHSATLAHQDAPRRGRGRPAKSHDNRRVAEFIEATFIADPPAELSPYAGSPPWARPLESILTGVAWLQSEGQASTRCLSVHRLRCVLLCPAINVPAVAEALGEHTGQSTAERYTLHARVASKAIASLLDQNPHWEAEAQAILQIHRC